MKEKNFQKRLKKSMIDQGIWCHNLADMPRAKGLRFIPEKPGDLIGAYAGVPFLIECKLIEKTGKISRNILRGSSDLKEGREFDEWHQVKALDSFSYHGVSFLFLCIYLDKPRCNMVAPLIWEEARVVLEADDTRISNVDIVKDNPRTMILKKGSYDMQMFKNILVGVAKEKAGNKNEAVDSETNDALAVH